MGANLRLLWQSSLFRTTQRSQCPIFKSIFPFSDIQQQQQQQRRTALTSSSAAASPVLATTTPKSEPVQNAFQINAALVLTRPPQITRDLTAFEKGYFLYQRRLNERTALPFSRYFYYKTGTPAYLDFKRKVMKRLTASRDIGKYSGYGKECWNDELLVGSQESEPAHQVEAIIRDAETLEVTAQEIGQANMKNQATTTLSARETEADKTGDQTSLDRKLQESVYLVVQNKDGEWEFPQSRLESWESLRQGAERIVPEIGGENLHTWLVGNSPVGHLRREFTPRVNPETGSQEVGEKTFFMKGRIMAGEVSLEGSKLGARAYKWLTRKEIEETVSRPYWEAVSRFLLPRI